MNSKIACRPGPWSWLTGGVYTSQVRNPVQASITHTMRPDEARALTGLTAAAWPADPMQLPPGEAYALGIRGSGLLRIRVPLLASTRVRTRDGDASSMLPASFQDAFPALPTDSVEATRKHLGNIGEPSGGNHRSGPAQLPEELDERRVLALLAEGYDIGRVIRELTGAKHGRQYWQMHPSVGWSARP